MVFEEWPVVLERRKTAKTKNESHFNLTHELENDEDLVFETK